MSSIGFVAMRLELASVASAGEGSDTVEVEADASAADLIGGYAGVEGADTVLGGALDVDGADRVGGGSDGVATSCAIGD